MNYKEYNLPKLPEQLELDCLKSLKDGGAILTPPKQNQNQSPGGKLDYVDPYMLEQKSKQVADNTIGFNSFKELSEYLGDDFVVFGRYNISESVLEWLRTNVIPEIEKNYMIHKISLYAMTDGTTGFPHIDESHGAFNYVLSSGNINVVTKFWKLKDEYMDKNIYPFNIYPFEVLDYIDEVRCKEKQWTFIRTDVLHTVHNLNREDTRILLQVSVNKN